jgi:L-rhamnose mutarotase
MERVCFLLRVRADRLDEYRERHRAVWPEMLEALSNAGWRNYSLFLRGDGLLVGYLETDDFDAALRAMDETDVNARWQAEMRPFFELPGDRPATDPVGSASGASAPITGRPPGSLAEQPTGINSEQPAGPVFERLEEVFHLA